MRVVGVGVFIGSIVEPAIGSNTVWLDVSSCVEMSRFDMLAFVVAVVDGVVGGIVVDGVGAVVDVVVDGVVVGGVVGVVVAGVVVAVNFTISIVTLYYGENHAFKLTRSGSSWRSSSCCCSRSGSSRRRRSSSSCCCWIWQRLKRCN